MNKKQVPVVTIIEGNHNGLRNHIMKLLYEYPELRKENIDKILTEENMIEFKKAFTTSNADPNFNYQFYEFLGDSTANNCIIWYFQRRFFSDVKSVSLIKDTMSPLAIMSRLKQEGTSVRKFSKFSKDKLKFMPYITMTNLERDNPTKVLEDVFESFIGCLVYHIDKIFGCHMGYNIAYSFIEKLYEDEDISLKKEDLYEYKSLLNEDLTKFPKNIKMKYNTSQNPNPNSTFDTKFISTGILYNEDTGKILLSSNQFYGSNKGETEKLVAKDMFNKKEYKILRDSIITKKD